MNELKPHIPEQNEGKIINRLIMDANLGKLLNFMTEDYIDSFKYIYSDAYHIIQFVSIYLVV